MQSQTRLIQEPQGLGDPRMLLLLLRVLIVDVRAEADLGECETRLRTTTTLLPAASTIATSKNLFNRQTRHVNPILAYLDTTSKTLKSLNLEPVFW